jgi:uncharacterized protein YciI
MATYLAMCEDNPGAAVLREEHLHEHLAYVETVMDRIRVAGPLREDDGDSVGGSCFIYRGASLDEARGLLEDDPYFRAGIYASVRWFRLNPAAGQWVGGRNW